MSPNPGRGDDALSPESEFGYDESEDLDVFLQAGTRDCPTPTHEGAVEEEEEGGEDKDGDTLKGLRPSRRLRQPTIPRQRSMLQSVRLRLRALM